MASIGATRQISVPGLNHPWINDPPIHDVADMVAGSLKTNTNVTTLNGGGAGTPTLVPARPGYFGVLEVHHVRTDFTDPSVDFDFQDSGGTTLLGGGPYDLAFTVDQVNDDVHETVMLIAAKTANTALQCAITNGGGGGQVDIHYHYWYERP